MRDKFGYITQVIGPVVDVAFEGEDNELPPIYCGSRTAYRGKHRSLRSYGHYRRIETRHESD